MRNSIHLKSLTLLLFLSAFTLNIISQEIEDFETGDFSQFEWEFGGNADWLISDQNPYEGVYSAQSGDIGDNQTSSLFVSYEVYSPEDISFWLRVSSEGNYDYLRFFVDNIEMGSWAGEVAWQQATFSVTAGFHTFKWEYDKDYSVSTGADACWIDLISFPPAEIEALFIADTTIICENDVVFFTDLSIGPITEWSWTFEGGDPLTSTEQNPVVEYPNEGIWDVLLEVTDGVETSQLFYDNYITVGSVPGIAPTPTGITFLCASWGNTTYNTTGMSGVTSYDWILEPQEAGTVSGGGTNVTILWDEEFLGEATLQVAGINYCGIGVYSNPLTITRYLPEVTLIVPSFVSISTAPFELTGGSPTGGEYTGTGVSNGMFDPAAAGLGTHIITYTYTDLNLCTNSADDDITVTEFTGVESQIGKNGIQIYPNPNTGIFTIEINNETTDIVNIRIYNAMNEVVFNESNILVDQSYSKEISLIGLSKGIYYLHIDGGKTNKVSKILIQ